MARKLIEVAFVVDDMNAAIERWVKGFGVGPFHTGIFEVPEQNYRGTVSPALMDVAFSFSNGALVELIQPLAGTPCIFSEAGPGFHHLMFEVADHDAEVARYAAEGYPVVQSGSFGGNPFSIIDTRAANGAYTEIMAFGEGVQRLYTRMKDAAAAWDGTTEPKRDLFAALAA
ncbi:MAG: VOC family protein [Novosphingobium sp.]|nr:VOC family protein [Novosphingobium sp.]